MEKSSGKVHRSVSEWERILELHKSSGLSQSEFCSREDIALTSFQKWRRKLQGGREASGGASFIEVGAVPKSFEGVSGAVELQFPSGLLLRIGV
jgi:transposase-like protein